jgi:hypothetical protein
MEVLEKPISGNWEQFSSINKRGNYIHTSKKSWKNGP